MRTRIGSTNFTRVDDGGCISTFMAMVDQQTGCVRAASADTKGATEYLGSSVVDFAKCLFIGKFRLRSDGEPSVVAIIPGKNLSSSGFTRTI